MSETRRVDPDHNSNAHVSRYTSFILRCWTAATGQVRVRLIEADSGVCHMAPSLAELPALIERLLSKSGDESPEGGLDQDHQQG
jgi:hypothetical protein